LFADVPPAVPASECLPAGVCADGHRGVFVPRRPRDTLSDVNSQAWALLKMALRVCSAQLSDPERAASSTLAVPSLVAGFLLAHRADLDQKPCAQVLCMLLARQSSVELRCVWDACQNATVKGADWMAAALSQAPQRIDVPARTAGGAAVVGTTCADFSSVLPERHAPAGTCSSHGTFNGFFAGAGAEHAGAPACLAPPWDILQWCDALLTDVQTSHGEDAVACANLVEAFHAACDERRLECWCWTPTDVAVARLRSTVTTALADSVPAATRETLVCLQAETLRNAATGTWLWLLHRASASGRPTVLCSACVLFELAVCSRDGIDFEILALWAVLAALAGPLSAAASAHSTTLAAAATRIHNAARRAVAAAPGTTRADLAVLSMASEIPHQLRRRALVAESDACAIVR
jgi:hypothetical protein